MTYLQGIWPTGSPVIDLDGCPFTYADAERLLSYVEMGEGCWEWQGGRSHNGYGIFNAPRPGGGRISKRAHRLMFVLDGGEIPPGMTLDHRECSNPPCVRRSHLEPVAAGENTLRGNGPPAVNARKTHCQNGHLFDQANTYVRANGYRLCRKCNAAAQRATQARKRAG